MNGNIPAVLTAVAVLSITTPRVVRSAEVPADIAEMKAQDLRVGGDAQSQYFVIHRGAAPPMRGFHPFATRIETPAERYLLVQLGGPAVSAQLCRGLQTPLRAAALRR